MNDILTHLSSVIKQRQNDKTTNSYVAGLFAKGTPAIAQKIGEEGVEMALALMQDNKHAITSEAADLLFHMMIGLHAAGLSLEEVCNELRAREGRSGLEEKAARKKSPSE